jgi:modulator of FtsH protease HflK
MPVGPPPSGAAMSWDPSDNDNPWKRKASSPPDLEVLFKQFFRKLFGGKRQSGQQGASGSIALKWWFLGGFCIFAVLYALAGWYVVSPSEQAVVQRFGRYVYTQGPGPHWVMPGIEHEQKINVQRISNFPYAAEMLTNDENIVNVGLAVQYRIINPRDFLFTTIDPVDTLQQATASALRQVVGHTTLDAILTSGRQAAGDQVQQQLQQTLSRYHTGLSVVGVTMQPATPPDQVTSAFDDATKAREDKQRYINKAEAYSNRVESQATGQIARLKQDAAAYKNQVVFEAKGRTAAYLAQLKPYETAPQVTRERMYLDTMSHVLANTHNVVLDSQAKPLLYLPSSASTPSKASITAAAASYDATEHNASTGGAA